MQALDSAPTQVSALHCSEPRVAAVVGSLADHADQLKYGDLLVMEDSITWWCEDDGKGFELAYPSLALHAVSRDGGVAGGSPCIYCQIYTGSDDDDDVETVELRLIPENSASLDTIFAALSECQALHPDEDDDGEAEGEAELYVGDGDGANGDAGESEDDGMFDDADNDDTDLALNEDNVGVDAGMFGGMVELTPEGLATMERLNAMLVVSEGATSDGASGEVDFKDAD